MVGSGMFDEIATLLYVGMISVVLAIVFALYILIDGLWGKNTIESNHPIKPEIELVVKDGNKIDTVYIYKEP